MYNKKNIKDFSNYLKDNIEQQASKGEKNVKQPELKIIYSDKFKKVLDDILNIKQSNISKRLLDLEKSNNLFDVSYIDIDKNEPDSITYLQSNRVNRLKKENKPESEYWTTKLRVKRKINRFIKQVLPNFSDKSIEKFANKFKTIIKEEEESGNFELVDGYDIIFWYNCKNYASDIGTLGGSCMGGSECGRYLNIYKNNPEQCKMLILKAREGNKIKGRAIVWKLSQPDGIIFMDRVYTNLDSDETMFTNYAKRQGWIYKKEQRYGETSLSFPFGIKETSVLEVKLDDTDFDLYPYLDTMRFYYPDKSLLRSEKSVKKDLGQLYTLTDTDGHYMEFKDLDDDHEDPMVHDDYNNQDIPENEAIWCDVDGGYCHRDDALRLAYIGEYAFPNSKNIVYSEYSKKYYNKKDCVFSKPLNSWIWSKYAVDVYRDKDRKQPPDIYHRFELNKTIGKVDEYYYDIELLKVTGSKQVPVKAKNKIKTEYTYEFKD